MNRWAASTAALGLAVGIAAGLKPAPSQTLLISGNFSGMLEPCGCTSPMIGGVRRLGTLAQNLRSAGPVTVLLTAGSVPDISKQTAIQARQNVLKAETAALVAKAIQADALGIGSQEASYGLGMVSEVIQLYPGHVVFSGIAQPPSLPLVRFAAHDDFLIGSAGDDSGRLASVLGGQSADAVQAARDLVYQAQLTGKVPVLMLDSSKSKAEEIASAVPSLRLIIYASEGSADQGSASAGGTWMASPGSQGRDALVLSESGGKITDCRVQKLTPDLADSSSVSKVMTGYLKRVDGANLLAMWPKSKTGLYAGAQKCESCHQGAYHTWVDSLHSQAYKTLQDQGHGQDPDCVRCHVTGLSSTSGFSSLAKTPNLASVSCENCHGPGEAHAVNPRWVKVQDGRQACSWCHTPEHSPGFDFASYWARIKHH